MQLTSDEIAKSLGLEGSFDDNCPLFIQTDTRQLKKENPSCFVALVGPNFDGHEFIADAIALGARVVIGNKPMGPFSNVVYFQVPDTLAAYGEIARHVREKSKIPWVGITGSVGKTSTRNLIALILREVGAVLETEKNNNNQIGVPLTMLQLQSHHQFAVLEAGTNHFGEIDWISKYLKPDVAVITNIEEVHIEFLKDVEGVAIEKSSLLKHLTVNGTAIVNEESHGINILENACKNHKVVWYGINKGDYHIERKICLSDGYQVTVKGVDYVLPYNGEHFDYQFLAALACAKELGVSDQNIQAALKKWKPVKGRLEVLLEDPIYVINDAYNASFLSMKAAFDQLKRVDTQGRKIAVLGDMKELGEKSSQIHDELLSTLVSYSFDRIYYRGEAFSNAVAKVSGPFIACQSNEEIFEKLSVDLKKEDAILFKASNSMKFAGLAEAIVDKWKDQK